MYLPLRVIAVLFLAGAAGNFIDRVRQGFVVDFFYFSLINFPIFNVADIYVTTATIALIVFILFYYKEADLERIFLKRKDKRGSMELQTFEVGELYDGERLDKFLATIYPSQSRTFFRN